MLEGPGSSDGDVNPPRLLALKNVSELNSRFVPLLDRPRLVDETTFGTASAGQAVRGMNQPNAACAQPKQWHISWTSSDREVILNLFLSPRPSIHDTEFRPAGERQLWQIRPKKPGISTSGPRGLPRRPIRRRRYLQSHTRSCRGGTREERRTNGDLSSLLAPPIRFVGRASDPDPAYFFSTSQMLRNRSGLR